MLCFFRKKTKWPELLLKVFEELPEEYQKYRDQLIDGICKKARKTILPGYYFIRFDYIIYEKYYSNGQGITLSNIKVRNRLDDKKYNLSISDNVIISFYIKPNIKYLDVNFVDIDCRYFDVEYEEIDEAAIEYVKELGIEGFYVQDVCTIPIEGREYIRLKELGDGDFLALLDDNIYLIYPDLDKVSMKLETFLEKCNNDLTQLCIDDIYDLIENKTSQ